MTTTEATQRVQLDEALVTIKELRADRDEMKTWAAAVFAHICQLSGKDPRTAPKAIQQIAESWRAELRKRTLEQVAMWHLERMKEHEKAAGEYTGTGGALHHLGAAAAHGASADALRALEEGVR